MTLSEKQKEKILDQRNQKSMTESVTSLRFEKDLKNNNQLLDQMMLDLNNQEKFYKPGSYWHSYEKKFS